jgi:hypothetical protein
VEVQQQEVGLDLGESRNGIPWSGDRRDPPVARSSNTRFRTSTLRGSSSTIRMHASGYRAAITSDSSLAI